MRSLNCIMASFAIVLATGALSLAEDEWCSGFSGSIFCFDFDRACQDPPPAPQACAEGGTRHDPAIRGVWQPNSWNVNTQSNCGSNMIGEDLDEILPSQPYGGRHANGGDESGQLGQNTVDLSNYVQAVLPGNTLVNGSDSQPLVLTFTMGALALGAMQFNNGYMELSLLEGDEDRWNPLTNPAKAPTDFVLAGTPNPSGCANCNSTCTGSNTSVSVLSWPTICQQEFPNALCPPKQTITRNTIAIGALALLDNNPCHCCTVGFADPNRPWRRQCVAGERNPDFPDGWQEPTNQHLSYFDGVEWRVLKAGMGGPGSFGDFHYGNYWIHLINAQGVLVGNTDSGWETVVLTIKTNTVDIYHKTKMVNQVNGEWVESWAESMAYDLPRRYAGAFNRLRAGTDENCQLIEQGDPNYTGAYACDPSYANGHRKCKVMKEERCDPTGGNATYRSSYVSFDNVRLSGGVGNMQTGGCCHADGTCTDVYPPACNGAGDRFNGPGTPCSAVSCCQYPFADTDHDGDVDMDDFGRFQRCVTGSSLTYQASECGCFDRNHDSHVDGADFDAFTACLTGSTVLVNLQSPQAGCLP